MSTLRLSEASDEAYPLSHFAMVCTRFDSADTSLYPLDKAHPCFHLTTVCIPVEVSSLSSQVLDKALTRPGRLSRRVVVPLPDERGRAAILAVHLRPTPMLSPAAKAEACAAIARLTGGFSGAELANVANEAALLAVRKGAEVRARLSS